MIHSRRATADIAIERNGSVIVRAPDWADDAQVEAIVASRRYWIYRNLAEWRDLNATRAWIVSRAASLIMRRRSV